jgi:BirA family biotin operon repressor/biotin-[acetyl-CoA-carboxylase] ligase
MVDSTMTEVERLKTHVNIPFCVSADVQTSGSGRGTNNWLSPKGGLWFSLCLHYDHTVPSFALYVGAQIHQVLTRLFPKISSELKIKWTNDIYWKDQKLAGILCKYYSAENLYSIGIGINTNNSLDSSLQAINAINLKKCIGAPISNTNLKQILCRSIINLQELGTAEYISYCNLHLYGAGKHVKVDMGNSTISGSIHQINPDGALSIKTENGTQDIYSGSLQF